MASSAESARLHHFNFANGGINLHGVETGPPEGPMVVLLHGFPEFWYGWRKQIGALASAGFHVVAPDGRGYNLSDKPREVSDYRISALVSDVRALCNHLGTDRIHLAGHDWGAIVAWAFAGFHPERTHRLAILNVPHPAVAKGFLLTHPQQLLRSWYMFYFQLPYLPELALTARSYNGLSRGLVRTSHPGAFTPEDLAEYREAWSQPGALTGMINWYRALFRYPAEARVPDIRVPVQILWGKRDAFLLPEFAEASVEHCRHADLIWFPEATHWLQHEEPDAVNKQLIDFFSSQAAR